MADVSISFLHSGGEIFASYRYRARMPSEWLGCSLNRLGADVTIFAKPSKDDVAIAKAAIEAGNTVIVDVCDAHMHIPHYRELIALAHLVTVPTQWMADYLRSDLKFDADVMVIPEPYEFDEAEPHCHGDNLLWFGHALNIDSLERVKHHLTGHPLKVVSNVEGAIPWSRENLLRELDSADIVVIPETAPYKSPNRAVEAIRRGCFVVAEPHPSLEGFPVYTGNIRKGIEWAIQNPRQANQMTLAAQEYVSKRFSPKTLESAWRAAIQTALSCSTSVADAITGTNG